MGIKLKNSKLMTYTTKIHKKLQEITQYHEEYTVRFL